MFRKIINTLRDGDAKTKRYLISAILFFFATILMLGAAIIMQSFLCGILAFFLALIFIAMITDKSLTTALSNTTPAHGAKKKANGKKDTADQKPKDTESGNEEETEEDQKTKKEKKKKEKKERKEKKKKEKKDRKEQEADSEREDRKKTGEKDNRNPEEEDEENEENPTDLTEQRLKKLLVTYKVKQEHYPVVLDLCVAERVKQSPGFAWIADGKLKILLVDGKPRLIERSVRNMQKLEVEKGVSVRASDEYDRLRDTVFLKKIFTPFLPRYHRKQIGGRTVLFKNLYILDRDMKFSSGSVSGLKSLLPLKIEINDRRLQESTVSTYYKELYSESFLWQDGIGTIEEYKKAVEGILQNMANADISYNEFENNLSDMIGDGLLPSEYRKFAYDLRENRNKQNEEEAAASRKKRKKK